jgi:RNA polymerase sigma-70 factor (ECF subfamily)
VVVLLRRARAGDGAAREELFRKCRNYVNLVARARLESWMRTKVDASDLVQQTLLDAHRGFGDFRGETEAEWLGWLRRILQHNSQDLVRQYRGTDKRCVQREMRIHAQDSGGSTVGELDPPSGEPTPSQMVLQRERELELADAMARLSEDHREVIMLRNLQRLPFDEVAERMGRSRPAVQMLWMRALRKLQQAMHVGQADSALLRSELSRSD